MSTARLPRHSAVTVGAPSMTKNGGTFSAGEARFAEATPACTLNGTVALHSFLKITTTLLPSGDAIVLSTALLQVPKPLVVRRTDSTPPPITAMTMIHQRTRRCRTKFIGRSVCQTKTEAL